MENLIKSFKELFNFNLPLAIHKSQRPYVWDIDKISRLIEDLEEFNFRSGKKNVPSLCYYMGTIVFYKNKESKLLELIDGQQRMTSLLMFDQVINKEKSILEGHSKKVLFKYSSSISSKNIKDIHSYLSKNEVRDRINRLKEVIKNRLIFTVITTTSEDEAFIYFDTQNNRGKKPSIDVVLKAVHLRGVQDSPELQEECAKTWEQIEHYKNHQIILPGSTNEFIYPFIKDILWRSRKWKYNQSKLPDDGDIEKTFSRSLKSIDKNEVVFFNSHSENNLTAKVSIKNKKLVAISNNKEILSEITLKNFPFQLRQPLSKGAEFFLYMENYANMFRGLFGNVEVEEIKNHSIILQLRTFYKTIYPQQSVYMRQYFMLGIISYYDKFGEDKLMDFALALDFSIGNERLTTYYIYEIRFIRKNQQYNIIDAIQMAYHPEEVINFIINQNDSVEQQRHNNKIIEYLNALSIYYTGSELKKFDPKKLEKTTELEKAKKYYQLISAKRKSWLLKKLNNYA